MSNRKNQKNYVPRGSSVKPDKETLQNEALLVYTLKTDSDDTLLKESEEFCFLVSEKWWEAYEVYLGYNEVIEEKPLKKSFGQKYPNPINEDIIGDMEQVYKFPNGFEHYQYLSTYLRPKALENESYILVDAKLWEHIYGIYGGKPIKRPLRHDYSYAVCDDLKKSHIVILTHKTIKEMAADPKTKTTSLSKLMGGFKNIQFHETWKMNDLVLFLSSLLEAETGISNWNIKVWRLNNYLYLDDFWRSLEDFLSLFPEQDKFLIEAKDFTQERFDGISLSQLLKSGYYLVIEAKDDENEGFYFDEYRLSSQNMKDLKGYCEFCNDKDDYLSLTCLCKEVFYCSEKCKYKDISFHHNICSTAYDSESDNEEEFKEEEKKEDFTYDRGLKNLGNTCYMNSVLQAFKKTRVPEELFYNNKYLKYIKQKKEENKQEEDSKFLLSKKFSKLMKKMSIVDKDPFAPWSLKQTFAYYFPNFKGYHQHDSQEFLAYLFNGLHEEISINLEQKLKNPNSKEIDYSNPEEYLSSSIRSSFSVLSELFQGLFSSEIKCPTCGHISTQYDQFNMVSLPLYCKEDHFNIVITYIPRSFNAKFETRSYKFSSNYSQTLTDLIEMLRKDLTIDNGVPMLAAVVEDDIIDEMLKDVTMSLKDIKNKVEVKRKKIVVYEMPLDWDSAVDHLFHLCFSTEIKKPNGIALKKRVGVPRIMVIKSNPIYDDAYIGIMDCLNEIFPEHINGFTFVKENIQKYWNNLVEKNNSEPKIKKDKKEENTKNQEIKETNTKLEDISTNNTNASEMESLKKMETENDEKNTISESQISEPTPVENSRPTTSKTKNKKAPRVSKRKKNTVKGSPEKATIKEQPLKKETKTEKSNIKENEGKNNEEEELDPETLQQDFLISLPYNVKFINKMKNIHSCVLCNKRTCESCSFNLSHSTPLSEIIDRCESHQIQIELNLFFPHDIPKQFEQSLDDPFSNSSTMSSTGNANPTLTQCIELFSEKEVLTNENMWFCPVCEEKKQAEKTIRLFYTSKYLIFHLKRFKSVEGLSSKNPKKVKNTQPIDYPINELDLTPFANDLVPHLKDPKSSSLKYRLIAVVLHEGKLDEGHYTSLGKAKDGWRKYDDDRVQEISEKDVCHKNAYLLFYELI